MKLDKVQVEGVFKSRFSSFYDSVVVRVLIEFRGGARGCRIEVCCQDNEVDSGWSNVFLHISNVTEFRFEHNHKMDFEVLSSGIQFAWRGEQIYVLLDAYPNEEMDLPDLVKNVAYVVGHQCDWMVFPYSGNHEDQQND